MTSPGRPLWVPMLALATKSKAGRHKAGRHKTCPYRNGPSPSTSPRTGEVNGFYYFDTSKGELVSGGKGKIAMWLLDTDYDERSLFPRQVFFPLAGKGEG